MATSDTACTWVPGTPGHLVYSPFCPSSFSTRTDMLSGPFLRLQATVSHLALTSLPYRPPRVLQFISAFCNQASPCEKSSWAWACPRKADVDS